MFYIDKGGYSTKEVADYLGVPERTLSIYYSKDQDNPRKPLHEFYDPIRNPEDGRRLESTRGYYYWDGRGSAECVYAEYEDEKGQRYSYVKHPRTSVADQIYSDKENANYKSIAQETEEATGEDAAFFEEIGMEADGVDAAEDKDFFEGVGTDDIAGYGEDRDFFESIDRSSSEVGETDEAVAKNSAEVESKTKGQKR